MKLLSLFDGSGGFPLAARMCGITPVMASEVEPYPIAVTRSRFPNMKHLGNVTEAHGGKIEPVDVITFGSPCQDLSVAGKRAGLKHEDNGDEETTRSGLFMEAVRIIKEMREATNGLYPTFAVWENVPGAFSSNKGEDFRIVLEELIKICEPDATVPSAEKGKWPYADVYMGDGWSLAYRVFDAQYWGVPQRRRRIYLVLNLRGERAGKVLFERKGLRGYFAESGTAWEETAGAAENCSGADDRVGNAVPYTLKIRSGCEGGGKGALIQTDKSATLSTLNDQYLFQPVAEQFLFENHSQDSRYRGPLDVCPMLPAQLGTGGNNQPFVVESNSVYCLQGNGIDRADTAGCNGKGWKENVCYTLNTIDRPTGQDAFSDMLVAGVDCRNATEYPELNGTLQAKANGGFSYNCNQVVRVRYIVRRLTPTECARLQGFPDKWGHPDKKESLTDEEYKFWLDVRNTHAEINGKQTKEYTREQMLSYYNKLHTDSAEYKMWGNGIALPNALYVMQGIADVLNERECDAMI